MLKAGTKGKQKGLDWEKAKEKGPRLRENLVVEKEIQKTLQFCFHG